MGEIRKYIVLIDIFDKMHCLSAMEVDSKKDSFKQYFTVLISMFDVKGKKGHHKRQLVLRIALEGQGMARLAED